MDQISHIIIVVVEIANLFNLFVFNFILLDMHVILINRVFNT